MMNEQRDAILLELAQSGIRPEAQERIRTLLSADQVSPEAIEEALSILQADLEADFASVPGLNEALAHDPDYQKLREAQEAELKEAEAALSAAGTLLTQEADALDALEDEIKAAESATKLDALRDRLGME